MIRRTSRPAVQRFDLLQKRAILPAAITTTLAHRLPQYHRP